MAKDIKKNDIAKKTLKHYIDLEFYANGVDADLQALLDEVTTDCEEVIESQKSYSTKDGHSVAYRAIKEKIESFGDTLDERLEKEAGTVKESEEKFLKGLYGSALAVAAVPLSKILFAPVDGRDTAKTFAERTKKNLLRSYDTALRSGYIFAKPSKDISSQAKAALPQIKRGMQAGIQTAIPAAAKTTDSIIFAANALEVVWCTTLDGNVCLECASLSGQHFKSMADAPSLPRHNRCRCVLLPAAMISEPLPSYQEFIESLSTEEQIHVLGKNRYGLYKQGISLQRFVNNGQTVPLKDLDINKPVEIRREIYKSANNGVINATYKIATAEEKENIAALTAFADRGDKVTLLLFSNIQNNRTADALINGDYWEVKTNFKPTINAIDSALRSCNGQSKNLLLNVVSEITDDDLMAGIKQRLHRTNIEKIIIERKGVIKQEVGRDDILKDPVK